MHRIPLLNMLHAYRPYDRNERDMYETLIRFVETENDCFDRSLQHGHVTGSAWVVDYSCTKVLLTHHRKLDRWLQLGGHADSDADILRVALREAHEESGISDIRPLSKDIFDVDVHPIPARDAEPRHLHYDVRFLLEADASSLLVVSRESKDLAWVSLSELTQLTTEQSIIRMMEKTLTHFKK